MSIRTFVLCYVPGERAKIIRSVAAFSGSLTWQSFPSLIADGLRSQELGQVRPPWQPKSDLRDPDVEAAIPVLRPRFHVLRELRACDWLLLSPSLGHCRAAVFDPWHATAALPTC